VLLWLATVATVIQLIRGRARGAGLFADSTGTLLRIFPLPVLGVILLLRGLELATAGGNGEDLGLNTLRCRLATLSSLCTWLVKRGTLSANPVARIDRPSRQHETPAVAGPAIMDALIDAAKHRAGRGTSRCSCCSDSPECAAVQWQAFA
jgi:hypothetical protein